MSKESNRLKKWGLLFFIFYLDPIEEIDELSGKKVKAFEVGKNIVLLNPLNWEEYATSFMDQKFSLKKREKGLSGITKEEFCKLELEYISQIEPSEQDIKVLIERYKLLLQNVQNTKDKPKPTLLSYHWNSNPDIELPELYSAMKDIYRLIDQSTTWEQFEAVFIGRPLDEIEPIKWHDDNATELLYFNEELVSQVDKARYKYKRMAACFVKPNGEPFDAVWKSLKTHLSINLAKRKQEAIYQMFMEF
jgi:hypothetical protein